MYKWKVVPLCKEQLLDVDPKDVLFDGDFRLCDVYKAGGGYDKFPDICKKRLGLKIDNAKQFIVQLYGCHLDCYYCYVTPNGVHGRYKEYTTYELYDRFSYAHFGKVQVFHLMGGSPALYIEHWPDLIKPLTNIPHVIFHSDLLLTEKEYDIETLHKISGENCLYAVNIKGLSSEDYRRNTGKDLDWDLFNTNLKNIVDCRVPFYFTFTNPDRNRYNSFVNALKIYYGSDIMEDSFIIDLIDYNAVKEYNKKEN